jgi:hypothetical protein
VIANGILYVLDEDTSQISGFDLNGVYQGRFGGYGSGPYQFKNAIGLGADAQGRLYVADHFNERIQVFDTAVPRPANEGTRPAVAIPSPAEGRPWPPPPRPS